MKSLFLNDFASEHVGLRQTFTLDPAGPTQWAEGRDLFGLRKDGTEFPVEIGLNPINSGAEKLVMITVIDISRRKLEQQRLDTTTAERDDLRRRFIQAQEQERLRLAHELHDQTGQSLTGVMLELKGYEDSVSEPDRTRLRLLRMQLDRVGQALHHVVWELRPPSIDELGLQSALGDYIEEWSAQYGIDADFHCSGVESDEISEEVSTTVYRVVQEALTNVVKHARQATSVSVVIDRTGQNLRLTVEDNGCGFGTDWSSEPKGRRDGGLGLPGMRERLTLIGGEFEVESSIGVGTTIFARIPSGAEEGRGVSKKSRIVLADDHPIVLGGLRNLIQAEPDLELVGEASSGLAALKVIREQEPDVAVIDISMPELNGIMVSRRLSKEMPAVKVLVLTLHEDRAYLQQALEAGVRGYVLSDPPRKISFRPFVRSSLAASMSIRQSRISFSMRSPNGPSAKRAMATVCH